MLSCILEAPFRVDPVTELDYLSFRFFHFDPTFAPPRKTAVTCLLPTRNFTYWAELRRTNPLVYQEQKSQGANVVITHLQGQIAG